MESNQFHIYCPCCHTFQPEQNKKVEAWHFSLSIGGESSWTTFNMLTWKTKCFTACIYRLLISSSIYRPGANTPVRVILTRCQWLTSTSMNSLVLPLSSEWLHVPKCGRQWQSYFPCFHKVSGTEHLPRLLIFHFPWSVLGIQQADEDEMKLMASPPYTSHIYKVANFDMIKNVQKELITQMCAGVDDQLNSLVSGEEGELW